MRRAIYDGLNEIENWNGANSFIFYGLPGGIATTLWRKLLAKEGLRALTPPKNGGVNPFSLIQLDMGRRLPIDDRMSP